MIVVFDAQCLLCNGWVQFILRHDRAGRIRFASMQGATGRQLLADAGLRVDSLQTLLVIDGARSWQHTAAILRVLHALGWPWRLAWVGWLVPAPLRDALYRWVARNRYRIRGVHGAFARDRCTLSGLKNRSAVSSKMIAACA